MSRIGALVKAGAFFCAARGPRLRGGAFALVTWGALPGLAQAEALAFPVDCTLGETCFIQHYVDRDPGAGVQDYGCGSLSYDGHDGTDIAIANRAEMARGVTVTAALPGVVKGIRDGVPDAAPFPEGQDCGNGVLIESALGQEQYCHLREGSVLVQKGQVVETGTPLGLIGQSGNADFPHLHLTLRRGGKPIDPFSQAATCGPAEALWADPLPYVPAGLVQAGIADAIPDYEAVKAGALPGPRAHAGALVIWGEVFGARPGDVLTFDLQGPEGAVYQGEAVLEKPQARAFRAQGRKIDAAPGDYRGTVTLTREGVELDRISVEARVTD
ncbi:M23 family metallopeptidase [Stagnihabitans tardus]|uniref:Peptidoglycan DD-metalloendopeptidase family protein n=1 Tax=Stagnihabitans tardus TaxID=2699202 RepID=A0AAE4YEM2_9RHOB|nr:M23 family metallopeptidase [Stagnihabitans tardus]NBZ88305.1 peptidoglycan DD-metalloendopeptidase family protein [Stagnihabitans tardus]